MNIVRYYNEARLKIQLLGRGGAKLPLGHRSSHVGHKCSVFQIAGCNLLLSYKINFKSLFKNKNKIENNGIRQGNTVKEGRKICQEIYHRVLEE